MIISVDVEKVFDETQRKLTVETLSRLGIEGNFLSLRMDI